MRTPIEKLAWVIDQRTKSGENSGKTLGQLAEELGEPVERVMDAIEVGKIAKGQTSILPPVDWS